MSFKYISLLAFVAVASGGDIPVAQVYHPAAASTTVVKSVAPVAHVHPHLILDTHHYDHYDPHTQYKFAYEINDEHTGDNHSHQEEREGDAVHGEYSLMDADGFKRIVQYTVDTHSGFNAIVNRIPSDQHVKAFENPVSAAVHPYIASAPTTNIVKKYPVPVAFHQHH